MINYKQEISRLNGEIKLAETLIRINELNKEIAKYNPSQLQKAAAVGAAKEDRIKLAALIRQREIEKQAFAGMLGGLARNAWKVGAKALPAAGKFGLNTAKTGLNAARGAGGLTSSALSKGIPGALRYAKAHPGRAIPGAAALGLGAGLASGGFQDASSAVGKKMQQMGNNAYYKAMRTYNRMAQPFRSVAAGVKGFGQGMYDGAKSMYNLPGALGSTLYKGFTGGLANKQGSDYYNELSANVKIARALARVYAIEDELASCDIHNLQKSAAVGSNKEQRIKAAALVRQHVQEVDNLKQAFLGSVNFFLRHGG